MRIKFSTFVFSFLAVIAAPLAALAGGPLFISPTTGQPYKYGPGPVRVYTDLGTLGILSNDAADALVVETCKQWTDVPSSSFEAQVVGDFAAAGLPEINSTNALSVLGVDNGGGIHVIYDHDAKILQNVMGAPSNVLGIAMPEWADEATGELTESWVVLNGSVVFNATRANGFKGVVTHEFGHSINLAHSQTNGAILYYGEVKGPAGCTTLPYSGDPVADDLETMYPVIQISNAGGVVQGTVNMADDIASISNIYPAPGWPENYGTITGTITQADGETQVTGVNVIARNIADPFKDAVSALSGDQTQGRNGPDGRYTLNGLTPGAQYVVYVDGIVVGGFSTNPAFITPGLEEFYNGENESGNGLTDDACEATPIFATVGAPATANISFNEVERGPKLTVLGNVQPWSITSDGSTVLGYVNVNNGGPTFRWTDAGGFEILGGYGTSPAIARDGSAIVGNSDNPADNNRTTASIWQGGTSWLPLPGLDGVSSDNRRSTAYAVTNGGTAVLGLGHAIVNGVTRPRAWRWDAATNTSSMLETPTTSLQSRVTGASEDGSIAFGFHAVAGGNAARYGVIWNNGVFTPLTATRTLNGVPTTYPVGEALGSNADGSVVVGNGRTVVLGGPNPFWRWTPTGGLEEVAALPGYQQTSALGVSANGNAITGFGQGKQVAWGFDNARREGFIWTPRLGITTLREFLTVQGMRVADDVNLAAPVGMSADGTRIIGSGFILPNGSFYGWVLDIQKVTICHAPPGNPNNVRTIQVDFESLDDHLSHGDTLGPCECEDDGNGNGNGNGNGGH